MLGQVARQIWVHLEINAHFWWQVVPSRPSQEYVEGMPMGEEGTLGTREKWGTPMHPGKKSQRTWRTWLL